MQPKYPALAALVCVILLFVTGNILFLPLAALGSFIYGWERAKVYTNPEGV